MIEKDYALYLRVEDAYKKKCGNKENLFPADWYSSKNYILKADIIMEAIQKKVSIEDTELDQTRFIEGVKVYKLD